MSDALTIDDVAQHFKCSSRHVRKMIARGELAAFRIGMKRGMRVPQSEIDRWERENLERKSNAMGSDSDGEDQTGLPTTVMRALASA